MGYLLLKSIPGLHFRKELFLVIAAVTIRSQYAEYIARGGYRTFVKTFRHYTLEEVCDIIERSGLRGRSGGGFPTGVKWKYALKYICVKQISDMQCKGERSGGLYRPHNSGKRSAPAY
jgi:Na+-translocating ferredoxin:NAD+ oxidoreductase RnfC subunit